MASYWIVVPRGNAELFELLSMAFKGRTGFSVIVDRRAAGPPLAGVDRRARSEALGPDEIVVAEQAERSATASEDRSSHAATLPRLPVVGRVPKQAENGGRRKRTVAPPSVRPDQRLFTL